MKFYNAEHYQPSCKALYAHYEKEIRKLLPYVRIEHIGASSVPLAISKGDLDIFVGVDQKEVEYTVKILARLGFAEKLDTLRTIELCMLESTSQDDVAVQIVVNNSEFECFLTFRDQLRANAALVKQYNQLKLDCRGLNQADYRKEKSAFIEKVIAQA